MKSLTLTSFVFALALTTTQAHVAAAASPEESYLAARDRYIATFKDREFKDDKDYGEHTRALADLGMQLRAVIGPVDIKGFSKDGTNHLDTLLDGDEGFGLLDGLVYATADDKTHVLVTTESLLRTWLRAHKDWYKENPLPQDVGAALKRDDFFTQALSTDAAAVTYGEIPVTKPAATIAFATLASHTQDMPPTKPDELIIFVMQAGKAFIVTAPTAVARPIASCEKLSKEAAAKAERAAAADAKAGEKNPALHEKATQLQHEAEWAYPRCYATGARQTAFFPALVKQAQALVDALP